MDPKMPKFNPTSPFSSRISNKASQTIQKKHPIPSLFLHKNRTNQNALINKETIPSMIKEQLLILIPIPFSLLVSFVIHHKLFSTLPPHPVYGTTLDLKEMIVALVRKMKSDRHASLAVRMVWMCALAVNRRNMKLSTSSSFSFYFLCFTDKNIK